MTSSLDRGLAWLPRAGWLPALLVLCSLPLAGSADPPPSYSPVTAPRLLEPEPRNWLMYRGTYDSWGYSELDQIDTTNASRLVPVWTFSTGMREGHQAPPIVNDGVMFTRKQDLLNPLLGTSTYVPQGGVLWVFALPDQR